MLAGKFRDMLRCIRCGACLNHCPIYHAVGGHAYGWVYPGPMGAVLTPSLIGVDKAGHPPNASTFCGRCEEVCPVRIPLPRLMRFLPRARVRAPFVAQDPACGAEALGLLRQAPAALSARDRARHAAARLGCPQAQNANGRLRRWLPRQIDIDKVSDEEIQDIIFTANLTAEKMPRFQDAIPGDPQRAWQRRPNTVFMNPLHLAPKSTTRTPSQPRRQGTCRASRASMGRESNLALNRYAVGRLRTLCASAKGSTVARILAVVRV